jgi:hypothetical protein
MKGKIVCSLHCTAIISLVMILVFAFQSNLFGQDVSVSEKEIWDMVESYWSIRKENSPAEIKSFYHNHYIHWGAAAGLPHSYSSFSPPSGQADALKGTLDSYQLYPDKIRVHNNFAIAMYFNKIVNNGKTHRLRCTDVWMKESNKWQLVATVRDSCNNLSRCPGGLD